MSRREREQDLGFSWIYPELNPEQKQRKADLMQQQVQPLVPSKTHTVVELVQAMAGMSIQARNVGHCYDVLRQMLEDPDRPTILLGLAGPLVAGGLREVLREMVEHGLVDVVVSTGAILYQDIYQARGYQHYRGSPDANDPELRDLFIDRIYDTYVDEVGFGKTDTWLGLLADELEPGPYSSRQFMDHIADQLDDPSSIVATCRRRGVPMFVPALNDSSIGIGLTEHHHRMLRRKRRGIQIDSIQDNYELTQIVVKSPATAAIYIAGGVPKNYINDSIVMSYIFEQKDRGHRYAIQMTTAVTADGGLSSSTLDEARSWGKIGKTAASGMAWVEPTVALPLLATAAIQSGLARGRPRLHFSWNGEILESLSHVRA
ncbi:MAG: deoxyhypusine synthase family protein [Deltaproteobacteria bacterium]|nr:deoxyhypusine synthase family protein [Myxococcales bacterium]MCZ6571079.1 deoxyhypusine synthase family protein [Deltaproteobacteria bacterium]MCZ6712626.1 deoxyhypusine synthase family protein [Deltaproteobacteria bacterium]MCZ6824027.1 deoxyhypusine synthase family protein [Deltaproteobacteria bacterium]